VLKITAEAFRALSTSPIAKLSIISPESVVLRKLGKYFKEIPSIPGIQSITVSKYPFVK
jgi:hypothetical protein